MEVFLESPRFPECVSWGSGGTLMYSTRVLEMRNGFEQRNVLWAQARRRYDIGTGLRTQGDMNELRNFFMLARGRGTGFRFKDWSDWHTGPLDGAPSATDEVLGDGDGTLVAFPLSRLYTVTGGTTISRRIQKPVDGTVQVSGIGDPLPAYTVDAATGIVTFDTPPTAATQLRWGGEYDTPVRFESDSLPVTWESSERQELQSGSLMLMEIRMVDE